LMVMVQKTGHILAKAHVKIENRRENATIE